MIVRDVAAGDRAGWERLWAGYLAHYGVEVPTSVSDHTWARCLDPGSPIAMRVVPGAHGPIEGFAIHVLHPSTWAVGESCYLEDLFVSEHARGRGVARALIVVPWALPSVIIGLIWTWMLDFNLGLINEVGMRLGLLEHPVPWLSQPGTALAAVVLAVVWQGFPFFAVTLLAGLQAIPAELYEAASLDGAGARARFRHVTLPGIAAVMTTALLLRMIWVANSLDLILVMTGGGPGTATQTLPLHAFLTAWSGGSYGQGSALAVILTLLLLGVVVAYLVRSRRA